MLERDVLADVLVAVTALPRTCAWRSNTGAAQTPDGRMVRFGKKGQPDVIGVVSSRGVVWETKKPITGRQRQEQRDWQTNYERGGGLYLMPRSAEDAIYPLVSAGLITDEEAERALATVLACS